MFRIGGLPPIIRIPHFPPTKIFKTSPQISPFLLGFFFWFYLVIFFLFIFFVLIVKVGKKVGPAEGQMGVYLGGRQNKTYWPQILNFFLTQNFFI